MKRARIATGLAGLTLLAVPTAAQPDRAQRLAERAHQDRDIVYFLRQPETHAFDLHHDYTESRAGVDKYLNVVRAGSTVSNPSAHVLDTGSPLRTEILRGEGITSAGIDIGEHLPLQSRIMDKLAIVRSGCHTNAGHGMGSQWIHRLAADDRSQR